MTILYEAEQRRCMGAAFYYSYDANLLGFMGNSCEVRVVNADTFLGEIEKMFKFE
jgi:hypothetical protein